MLRALTIVAVLAGGFLCVGKGLAQEVIPAGEVLSGGPAISDKVRTVKLNLSIDISETHNPTQLKIKGDGVLANRLKVDPERLEFEVLIQGPGYAVPVYFPVPPNSPVYQAYLQYKDSDPQKVLESLETVCMPIVRVVGLRGILPYEDYRDGQLVAFQPTNYWRPFYEVSLPAAAGPKTQTLLVPPVDRALYAETDRAVNRSLFPPETVFVAHIYGYPCMQCCPHCHPGAPCGSHHSSPPNCACHHGKPHHHHQQPSPSDEGQPAAEEGESVLEPQPLQPE